MLGERGVTIGVGHCVRKSITENLNTMRSFFSPSRWQKPINSLFLSRMYRKLRVSLHELGGGGALSYFWNDLIMR